MKGAMEFVPYSELDALFVARELKAHEGRRVETLLRMGEYDLVLLLNDGSAWWISAHPRAYRMHRVQRVEGPARPVTEVEQALKGFALRRVALPRGERILFLEFTGTTRLGEVGTRVLVVELMGRYSQVVLLGPERRILWTLKTVTAEQSRVRTLKVGGVYTPPPAKPWSLTDPDRAPERLEQAIRRVFPVPEGEEARHFLKAYVQEALEHPQPGLFRWQNRYLVLPLPVPGVEPVRSTATVSEAWETLMRWLQEDRAPEPASSALQRIRRELEKLARYERWNLVADALLLRREELLRQGHLEIPLPDGTTETVTLEPGDTPELLAQQFRARAARWKRGYHKLLQRLRELETGVSHRPQAPAPQASEGPALPYEVYRSPSGFLVYVGKNARGNERITFSLAAPDDYFLHARGVPGAHVILKTGRREPTEEDLLFAARLALQHSRAAADGKGEVAYTRVRYLKKPRNAPPGLVILTRERVFPVRL